MSLLNRKIIIIVILTALPLAWETAFADEDDDARLSNLVVTNTHDDLVVYLSVEGAFTDKMKKAVLSGVPATFSYFVTLQRVRNFWFDKEIADLAVTHTIKYHTLKKEFIIKRSWEGGKQHVAKSFEEARRLMTRVDGLKVVSVSELDKGRQYQIQAKAKLDKLTLPLYLHYIIFFVSMWDFETDWYTIDFVY